MNLSSNLTGTLLQVDCHWKRSVDVLSIDRRPPIQAALPALVLSLTEAGFFSFGGGGGVAGVTENKQTFSP